MTKKDLKSLLYEHICSYFSGARVLWGRVNFVKPSLPYILLQVISVKRNDAFSIQKDGEVYQIAPSQMRLQIDLFTNGRKVETEDGSYFEDTSTQDLASFLAYLDSKDTLEFTTKNDIRLLIPGDIQNLSEVVNGTSWQYRSTAEIVVFYNQWNAGPSGVIDKNCIKFEDGVPIEIDKTKWKQTPSGGGSIELAKSDTANFTGVVIVENKEEQ